VQPASSPLFEFVQELFASTGHQILKNLQTPSKNDSQGMDQPKVSRIHFTSLDETLTSGHRRTLHLDKDDGHQRVGQISKNNFKPVENFF
jgi:hypothetical protein